MDIYKYECDFECKKCGENFTVKWNFGADVTCPHCNTKWETEYDENWEGDIQGPWLSDEVTTASPPAHPTDDR